MSEKIENNRPMKHWTETYYVFELLMFLIGIGFLAGGYILSYHLFDFVGGAFFVFGMIHSFIKKRGGKQE